MKMETAILLFCVHFQPLSRVQLFAISWTIASVHGILQAKILEWVSMPSSRDLHDPGIEAMNLMSAALARRFFTTSTTWEAQ